MNFAIGTAAEKDGTAQAYTDGYIELYNGRSFWFVANNTWYGGVRGNVFNWVWFRDGTTNTPMIEIDRATGTITNYSPTIFQSPLTIATTNAQPAGVTMPSGVLTISTNKLVWLTITNAGLTYSVMAVKN